MAEQLGTDEPRTSRPQLEVVPAPPPPVLSRPSLPPPEQLTGLLLHYRRHGASFDVAWVYALELVRWPKSRRDAGEWRRAVESSREGWRASYEGWAPEPREVAVGQLAAILSDELRRAAVA